jgi:uncharacterized membrane protein
MKKHLLILLFSCIYLISNEQVIFKNSGWSTLKIAIGFYDDEKGWTTKGWFALEPREVKPIYNFNSYNNPTFYYCARIEGCDSGYYGNNNFFAGTQSTFIITNADKEQKLSKGSLIKYGFNMIDLSNKHSITIEFHPVNLICSGKKQGKWQFYLNSKNEYTEKSTDAVYTREITFNQGKPAGPANDYYLNGKLKAEFVLSSFQPDVYDGVCSWYKTDGTLDKQLLYQNGTGKPIEQKSRYQVVSFPPEKYYLSSASEVALKGGKSRFLYSAYLPKNTVEWYYQFSSSVNEKEVVAEQSQFQLIDLLKKQTGNTTNLPSLEVRKGGNGEGSCTIYLMDQSNADAFLKESQWTYFVSGSSMELKSGIMQVKEFTPEKLFLALENPDQYKGVYVSVQVVAVVMNK